MEYHVLGGGVDGYRKVEVEVVAQALMEIGNGEEWKIGEEA